MNVEFYAEFKYSDSSEVSKELWKDLLETKSLDKIVDEVSIIPEGFDGAGEELSRAPLEEIRSTFITELSRLLVKYSKNSREKESIENIKQLLKIISNVNEEKITHIRLDI